MRISVDLYAIENDEDQKVGTLIWDGFEFSWKDVRYEWVKSILEEKVQVYDELMVAKDNPEKFIRNLDAVYHGTYFRAGKPRIEEEDSMTNIDSFNDQVIDLWRKYEKEQKLILSPLLYNEPKRKGILFIGLNPSYSPRGFKKYLKGSLYEGIDIDTYHKFKNINKYRDDLIKMHAIAIGKYDFYVKSNEISDEVNLPCSYVDLFCQRKTEQNLFAKSMLNKGKLLDFGVEQLKITTDIIDYIGPKVIVVANALARDIMKIHMTWIKFGDKNEDYCVYPLTIKGNEYITFLSGMLAGQRAMDVGSFERLKWHIKYIVDKLNLR